MIIQFKPKSKTNRVEALMKGEITYFTCNTCGKGFEVYFNDRPDECPHCKRNIDWDNSEVLDDRTN